MHRPIQRVRQPEIEPLELSDLWVDGATLWEWSQELHFPLALRQALQILHAGQGCTRNHEPVPAFISGFQAAFLSGGRVDTRGWRGPLSGLPFAVRFAQDPVFAGVRGGLGWLRMQARSGWVADLGKSQLKLAAPGRQWVFPRDWTRLRLPSQVSPTQLPAQCRRLREFIALGLQFAMADSGQRPHALVFGFPTCLAEDGTPASSSYAGMKYDRSLLPDALELAGLGPIPVYVFNDAELAALSALSCAPLAAFRNVLVLTLGCGIGAAMVRRSGD